MGVYIPYSRLPSEYQEVDYIQSDGNQIIDTGVYGTGNTSILTKMVVTGRKGNYDMYYGAYMDNGAGAFFMQSNYPDNNKIRVVNYSNDSSTKKYVDSTNNLQFDTEYIIEHTNTKFIIDGILQGTMASSSFTTNYTLCLFGFHGKTGLLEPRLIGKIYYFKIYNNGTLVRDFVPCYRKSDNVIGLYDLVNNQFYTNAGTGTFTKGKNISVKELYNAYIGKFTQYKINFRGSSQSAVEALGRTFTARNGATWSFDSNGMQETGVSKQVFVNRIIDTTQLKKIHMEGSCYLANKGGSWDGGIIFVLEPSGQDFFDNSQGVKSSANRNVGTSSANRGYRLSYNGTSYTTGTELSAGEYTRYLNINLITGSVNGGMSNGLTLSGTINSTYLGYIKTSSQQLGVILDSNQHILHDVTFDLS